MTSIAFYIYNIYILFVGEYISIRFIKPLFSPKYRLLFLTLCPSLLLVQGLILLRFDEQTVRLLYPFIVHLPTIFILMIVTKVRWHTALLSVMIAYSFCQLFRWVGLLLSFLIPSAVLSHVFHLALCQLILIWMDAHYFDAIHHMLIHSSHEPYPLGLFPFIYYLYDYFVLYTQDRFSHILALNELLPSFMVLFFVLYITLYQRETEKREQAANLADILESNLASARNELSALHSIQEQTAIYRHDLRHHLSLIRSQIETNQPDQALAYIQQIEKDILSVTPFQFCGHETVNLLLSKFKEKADRLDVQMTIHAVLPDSLSISDTELCVLFSNGLENALNAVSSLPRNIRFITLSCSIRQGNLLLSIENPYQGEIHLKNGIPVHPDGTSSYGCRSIQSIVMHKKGVCIFETAQGIFHLRIALPLLESLSASACSSHAPLN
ncbi:MAG: GHKL domain-containing protein [Clostridia bacterium]|nr:GHKL domain-containing protein [Clostridia bacterium]